MKSLKLRVIFIAIAVIYILVVPTVFAVENDVNDSSQTEGLETVERDVSLENQNIWLQQRGVESNKMKIYNFEDREMLQLRDLAEEYGWSLYYNSPAKEIRLSNEMNSTILGLSGEQNDSIELIDGRTYISIETASDLFNRLNEGDDLLSSLYTKQREYMPGESITAHIRVYNLSAESIKLDFSSGQRYDLYLLKDNEEIWRWSNGRYFTMALVQKELKPGEKLAYDVEIDPDFDLNPGEYILSGELVTTSSKIDLNELSIIISDN